MEVQVITPNSDSLAHVSQTLGDDGPLILNDLFMGNAELLRIGNCHFVTRVEEAAGGLEMVIMCAQGEDLVAAGQVLADAARNVGCKTMRFHTQRPGMARLLSSFNFHLSEYVYKADL